MTGQRVRLIFTDDDTRALNEPGSRPLLLRLGKSAMLRISHVEPVSPSRRRWFRLLRRLFGDEGRVAAWTRRWRGPWRVDFSPSGGGVHEVDQDGRPFATHADAVEFELPRAWKLLVLGAGHIPHGCPCGSDDGEE